jgi:MoxR-like ATPase
MTLCSATHPDSECASEAAKKYVRLGASPRAGQALISAAKVRALLNGRFNVSYSDVNELAYPVLRHRMKLTFGAIAERVSADDIITMIINELAKKNELPSAPKAVEVHTDADEMVAEEPVTETKKAKRGIFGRK